VKRTAELNGIEIFYSDAGDHGRNVLLIHGHPFNHTMWRPQAEYLQENHRVLVPDLRGYGKSPLPDECLISSFLLSQSFWLHS
jgi:pimeloyl-ACP methyl ester carboxylesterase